jgi:hypothetical protein
MPVGEHGPIPAPSMEIMQPFNIPTSVNAPIRTGPRMNLTFPVFTPPAASSYGSTQPMAIPWHPPDFAGAINAGIQTGSKLATDFLQNRKTAQEINAEEAVAKPAIQAMHDPNMRQYAGYSVGPGGFTATIMSPAAARIQQAEYAEKMAGIGKSTAETAEAQQRTAAGYGQTAEAQSKLASEEAARKKTEMETSLMGENEATRRWNSMKSGMLPSDQTQPQQPQQPSDQDIVNQPLDQ